jgi:hypothetical protein
VTKLSFHQHLENRLDIIRALDELSLGKREKRNYKTKQTKEAKTKDDRTRD